MFGMAGRAPGAIIHGAAFSMTVFLVMTVAARHGAGPFPEGVIVVRHPGVAVPAREFRPMDGAIEGFDG
jgi:hypothetical protein